MLPKFAYDNILSYATAYMGTFVRFLAKEDEGKYQTSSKFTHFINQNFAENI